MRLINATTLTYQEFFDTALPKYAILSHCWGEREASYQDALRLHEQARDPTAHLKKILACCRLARIDGIEWVWVDTCCIDKSSSAELSEAINSMFSWYQRAHVCYVFLSDLEPTFNRTSTLRDSLSRCRWFTRGWTLQELIAPNNVCFYDSRLLCVGTKSELARELAAVTGVPEGCLRGHSTPGHYSVAQRMSWASRRLTTRQEDIAYCLLGIFDVNMPLLYGEGTKAFKRLQQAIIAQYDDESIFAWVSSNVEIRDMLANSPAEFGITEGTRSTVFGRQRPPPTFTSRGLMIQHSYAHPAEGLWEFARDSLLGESHLQQIALRLDCTVSISQRDDHWIGIMLQKDSVTRSWFRSDASKMYISPRAKLFQTVYPSFAGHKTIYVAAHITRPMGASSTTHAVHSRSAWSMLRLTTFEAFSASAWLWFASKFHHFLALPPPTPVIAWVYLTAAFYIQGNDLVALESLGSLIFLVWCNGEISWTYDWHNASTALCCTVPMLSFRVIVNNISWQEVRNFEREAARDYGRKSFLISRGNSAQDTE